MLRIKQAVDIQTILPPTYHSSPLPCNTFGYSLRNNCTRIITAHYGTARANPTLSRHCDNNVRSPLPKCTSGPRRHQRCASSAILTESPLPLETSDGHSDSIVSVVLPLGNEDPSITYLISSIGQVLAEKKFLFEILCIDNGSNNGTAVVLKALASEANFVKVVMLSRRVEDDAAISAGLEYAVGDVIVTLKGDLTSAPLDVSTLMDALLRGEGAGRDGISHLVCGWRPDPTLPFRQRVVSTLATWIMVTLTQIGLRDFSSRAMAFHASLLDTPLSPFTPALAAMAGATITQVELSPRPAPSGPPSSPWPLVWSVLSSSFLSRFQRQPMAVVGPMGGMCMVGSVLFGAEFWRSLVRGWAAYGSWGMAWASSSSHFMASLELLIMGAQLLCTGLVAEIGVRTFFESRRRPKYNVVEVVNS